MLASFTIRRTLDLLRLSLWVDVERGQAFLTIVYDGQLKRIAEPVAVHLVDTPAKAEAWLLRPMGDRGNLTQGLEWFYRAGLDKVEARPCEPCSP